METKKKTENRGGARQGAGRKGIKTKKNITVTLDLDLIAFFEKTAFNRSRFINMAIREKIERDNLK